MDPESAEKLLKAQKSFWDHFEGIGWSPVHDLVEAGLALDKEGIERARRRGGGWDVVANTGVLVGIIILVGMMVNGVILGVFLTRLALVGDSSLLRESTIALGTNGALLVTWVVIEVLLERKSLQSEALLRELLDRDRLSGLAMGKMRVESLPVRTLTDPRFAYLRERAWEGLSEGQRETAESLCAESSLSIEQMRQAVRSLA